MSRLFPSRCSSRDTPSPCNPARHCCVTGTWRKFGRIPLDEELQVLRPVAGGLCLRAAVRKPDRTGEGHHGPCPCLWRAHLPGGRVVLSVLVLLWGHTDGGLWLRT